LDNIACTAGRWASFCKPKLTAPLYVVEQINSLEISTGYHPHWIVSSVHTSVCIEFRIKRMVVDFRKDGVVWLIKLVLFPIVEAWWWTALVGAVGSTRIVCPTAI
jgi:hypothetical protein